MITRASAFFDRRTRNGIFADRRRGRTLILLLQYGVFVEDLAMALNCSESIIRSLLAQQYCSLQPFAGSYIASNAPAIDSKMAIHRKSAGSVIQDPSASEERTREQEELARQLAMEVRRWLCTFEISDADRQFVIEQAGFLLDESPLNATGEHDFQVNRAFLEVIGVWGKSARSSHFADFRTRLGQWLASWIRFWITDPVIWNRGLDLEYARFCARSQAA